MPFTPEQRRRIIEGPGPEIFIGRCSACRRTVRDEARLDPTYGRYRIFGGMIPRKGDRDENEFWFDCTFVPGGPPDCPGKIIFKRIRFKSTATPTKCGGACRAARGPNCDCECGGAHHGEVYSQSNPLFGELSPLETVGVIVFGGGVLIGLTLLLVKAATPAVSTSGG
jgi:hypothetical protein